MQPLATLSYSKAPVSILEQVVTFRVVLQIV
jgi:hypothetical protein